jgi:tetratricopeptide (TPR) repeat protein
LVDAVVSGAGGGWRVFISHTAELREFPRETSYVAEVERAISAASHVIVDMADFPAADLPPTRLCVERVQGCDVYLGVLGTRYGSPVRDRPDLSYTELEFETATQANLDRLVFLLDTDAEDVGIPLSRLIDREYGARQDAFRRRIQDSGLTTHSFKSPAELGRLVERSLRQLADTRRRLTIGISREKVPTEPQPVGESRVVNPPPAVAPTWFQDRQVETGLLARSVTDQGTRMVTVVGRGGIGKTAMVCRLLKGLEAGHIPDMEGSLTAINVSGIVYMGRNGVHQVNYPTLVTDLLRLLPGGEAQRLRNLYQDPHHTPAQVMLALLEAFPVGGPVVVLLDNLESVMDTERETLLEPALHEALSTVLTAPAHSVTLIVTTRVAPTRLLLIAPACHRRLSLEAGLGSPDAEAVLRELDSDGHLGLRDAPDELLDGLRQHTQGLPRALEAVKAILDTDDTLTPQDLLDRTRHLPEGQIVEVLVGEAYELLDEPARQVMQALSVYPAPVSAVGVDFLLRPINPTTDAAPILSRLVRRQLVRFHDGLYQLHPVDQDYARRQLPPGGPGDPPTAFTRTALTARAADYYAAIRTPRESWRTSNDIMPRLAEFELRCAAGDFDTAATVLSDIDLDYLRLWGHYRTLIDLHERIHGRINDPFLDVRHLNSLGLCHSSLGDYRQAIELHARSLAIAREIGDRQGEGAALGSLGFCHSSLGDYRQAIELHTQSLAIAREIGDPQGESAELGNLGSCHYSLGDYWRAIELGTQAMAIAHEIGDRRGEGAELGNLGDCHCSLGNYRRAIELHAQSLAIAREIGDHDGESAALGSLGTCHSSLGDYWRAIELHTERLEITRDVGDRYAEGAALSSLGGCHASLGYYRQAIELHARSLAIAREIGDRQGEGAALGRLGFCHYSLGSYRLAIGLHTQSLAVAREIGDRQGEGAELGSLGDCHLRLSNYRQAIELHTQRLEIVREIGDRRGEGAALGSLGSCHYSLGDYRQAIELHTRSLAIVRKIGDRYGEGAALGNLGDCHAIQGDYRHAIELHTQSLAIAREIGDLQGESAALGDLGDCHAIEGDYRQAIELHTRALCIAREIGDRQGEGAELGSLGGCHYSLGDFPQAIDLGGQALRIAREIGDRYGEANALNHLGRVWLASGDGRRGKTLHNQAARLSEASGDIESATAARLGLARAHLELNEPAAALTETAAAAEQPCPTEVPTIHLLSGVALLELRRIDESVQAFTQAVSAADALLALKCRNMAAQQARALALSGLAAATGDATLVKKAKNSFAQAQTISDGPGDAAGIRHLFARIAAHDLAGVLAHVQAPISSHRG